MKKSIAVLLMVVGCLTAQAQENIKKSKYVQNGDKIEATIYHVTGEISQKGFFTKEGVITGEWISFDTSGVRTGVAKYENGKKVGKWLVWGNNKLTELTYENSQIASVNVVKNDGTRVAINK